MSAGLIKQLADTLQRASESLEYCGYGDAWERECAFYRGEDGKQKNVPEIIADALKVAEETGWRPE